MNIRHRLENEKLGLFTVISLGFNLYFSNFREFLLPYLFLVFPFHLTYVVLLQLFLNNSAFGDALFLGIFIAVLGNAFGTVFYIAVSAVIVENIVYQYQENPYERLRSGIFQLFLLRGWFLFNYLLLSALFYLPGIIYGIDSYFYDLAYILRERRGNSAFKLSRFISKGNWGKVFLLQLLSLNHPLIVIFLLTLIFISTFTHLSLFIICFISIGIFPLIWNSFYIGKIVLFLNIDSQKDELFDISKLNASRFSFEIILVLIIVVIVVLIILALMGPQVGGPQVSYVFSQISNRL